MPVRGADILTLTVASVVVVLSHVVVESVVVESLVRSVGWCGPLGSLILQLTLLLAWLPRESDSLVPM